MVTDGVEERPAWQNLPDGMAVTSVAKMFVTQPGATEVWLWLRYPMMCLAVDFDPDAAELLGHGLINAAAEVRRTRTETP